MAFTTTQGVCNSKAGCRKATKATTKRLFQPSALSQKTLSILAKFLHAAILPSKFPHDLDLSFHEF